MNTTYKRVMKGKKTTYEAIIEEPRTVLNLTEPECLTAAGALGVTLLMIFERNLPKMKNGTPRLAERKISALKAAVLDLYKGTGEAIKDEIAELIFKAWDGTMAALSGDEAAEDAKRNLPAVAAEPVSCGGKCNCKKKPAGGSDLSC